MSPVIRRTARRILGSLAIVAFLTQPASAIQLIRDAEIERTLKILMGPITEAAGVPSSQVDLYMIKDRSLNAYVAGGANIFLHTGLLIQLDEPEELMAVLAHELGHITGGHLARLNDAVKGAVGKQAIVTILAAAAAAAAGGEAAGAVLGAGSAVVQRNLLAYSRGEEASADQAAITYMERAGIDPRAMISVLELFRGQELLSNSRIDPYARTHPLSRERISMIERRTDGSRNSGAKVDQSSQYWHARLRAKLLSFLGNPEAVLAQTEPGATDELSLYRRAAALHRLPDFDGALAAADALIAIRPDDAFYHELKGQILFESARGAAAIEPYRRAVALAPNEPLIRAGLGRALLSLGQADTDAEALRVLESAAQEDRADGSLLRALALAYARDGNEGMAALTTAERIALFSNPKEARRHAQRATDLLPNGSPGWLRAQDILATMAEAE